MSISINTYDNSSSYTTSSDSSNSVASKHHPHRHSSDSTANKEQSTSSDSVQFSLEMMEYLAGSQNQTSVSTGNYGSDSGENALTTEQKKSILANLQTKLSSLGSSPSSDLVDNAANNNADNTISTIKDELSTFNASTATDQQVSDLFGEVTQTLESSRPSISNSNASQQAANLGGLPPMMKAMGGVVPPFAWGIGDEQDSQQSGDNTVNTLTTDQKKSILADMQNKLSSLSSSGSNDSSDNAANNAAKILSTIKDELSGFDASTATDQQVSDLFNEVAQSLETSRPSISSDNTSQQAANQGGLPPMMKAMGRVMPPFAWGIGDAQDSQQSGNNTINTLTTDQKKSILADMQNYLSLIDSSQSIGNVANNDTQAVSTIKDELSGFDASTATDQQISDPFGEVTETIEQSLSGNQSSNL